ncbi:MAG: zinc ribbon domain-containing protein [Nitrospirae bacterium]|nr:MAG: zinc ribbon domain-containing protein [Nitrospirota bacterium]
MVQGVKRCPRCGQELSATARFCITCGKPILADALQDRARETLNMRVLYLMVGLLILAVLFPPWEAPPSDPPEYLGFHFILSPPRPGAVISRLLQTIELVTIAVAGLYGAWLFRERPR